MNDVAQGMKRGISHRPATPFVSTIEFLFLIFLSGACLVLTDFMDVNEPKWFLIRTVAPVLFVLVLLRDAFRRNERYFPVGPLGGLAVVFLGLHLASTLIASNGGRAWTEASELAGLVCAFFLAAKIASSESGRDRILWTLVLIGVAVSGYGIAQHYGVDFMSWQENKEVLVSRGVSFFGHATFTASVLIQIIPVALGLLATRKGWLARLLLTVICALMLYHLSFTGARMATLSFVFTGAAVGCWIGIRSWRARRERGGRGLPLRAIAAAVAVVLIAGTSAGWFVVRAWQTKDSDLFAIRQASLALRIFHWETASRIVFAHPVTGVGAGNYEVVSPSYWNAVEQMRTARNGRWMQQAHNEYLQTAAELGLPGIAVLFSLIAYGIVLALDVSMRARMPQERWLGVAMAASIGAIALDANITFSLQAPGSALLFWTMLGLIAGSRARLRADQV